MAETHPSASWPPVQGRTTDVTMTTHAADGDPAAKEPRPPQAEPVTTRSAIEMTTDLPRRHPQTIGRGVLALVLVAVLIAIIGRFSMLGAPFGNDSGLYVGMGKVWVDGGQVYEDLWDTKLPGVVLLGGVPYALFGSAWPLYLLSQFLLGTAAALLVAATVGRLTGDRNLRGLTFAVAMVLLNHPRYLGCGFQIETPQVFFAAVCGWAAARVIAEPKAGFGWSLVAGLAAGLAAMAKPTGLSVAGAYAVALTVVTFVQGRGSAGRWLLHGLATLAGTLLVFGAVAWWTWSSGMMQYMPRTWHEISLYGSGTPWAQVLVPKVPVLIALPLLPALGALAGRVFARSGGGSAVSGAWVFALTWFALETVGVVLQKRAYSYQFLPLLAPAAVVAGLAASVATGKLGRLGLLGATAVLALLGLAMTWAPYQRWFAGEGDSQVAAYLQEHSTPDDALFADNVGRYAVLADRPVGARLGMMIHLINHDDAPKQFMDELLIDLEDRQPTYILLPAGGRQEEEIARWERQPILQKNPGRQRDYRDAWNRYLSYVDRHYVEETQLEGLSVLRRVGK